MLHRIPWHSSCGAGQQILDNADLSSIYSNFSHNLVFPTELSAMPQTTVQHTAAF